MKTLFLTLLLILSAPLYAVTDDQGTVTHDADNFTTLFPGVYLPARTINWSYDNSCTTNPLPELQRVTRVWDRLLPTVTINYTGIDYTGFNYSDNKNTVSCHNLTWFSDSTGTLHRNNQSGAGAFGDHSTNPVTGEHLFDIAFRDDIVTADGKPGAALHEWTHVLGLDHSTTDWWSAVWGSPFGFPGPANPYNWGWTGYPSNDDIVGLSTVYGHAADCTPYLGTDNKLYLPFIPASGSVNSAVYATGYWAVLQWNGTSTATMLQYGTTLNYRYSCSESFSAGMVTATGYRESTQAMLPFRLINNDPTGASVTSWTLLSP